MKGSLILLLLLTSSVAHAIGTSFTYQGQIQVNSVDAEGSFDFTFDLYDAQTGGVLIATSTIGAVDVSAGVFTVTLDFGSNVFDGQDRWLEIRVASAGGSSLTTLVPRQVVNPSPYAIRADSSEIADGAVMADSADSVPFAGITGLPAGLADGDDDTLGDLMCSAGQYALFDGAEWMCVTLVDNDTLGGLACASGQVPVFNGVAWQCADPIDNDTLGNLFCAVDQVAVFDGGAWQCGNMIDTDTLGALTCTAGQIAVFSGSVWECQDPSAGSPASVCVTAGGAPGLLIDGVCLLGYSNTSTNNWNDAASACAALGGDLCTGSQYDGLRSEGTLLSGSVANNDIFSASRAVWSNDFSDNDGGVKTNMLRSSDDPNTAQQYAYGCCGNVLAEPYRSLAETVNGVLATRIHTAEDTAWRAAARICRSQGADLCTKSQYVALNDAGRFNTTVRRATPELSDNDGDLMDGVVGTNAQDNGSLGEFWAYGCCGVSRPVDQSCAGTLVSGICVRAINDSEDTNFFDAARACTAMGADICSKSQMQVLRNFGQFSGQCWTNGGADNDSTRAGGLLGTQPDNPNPDTTLMGYACCQ